MDTKDEQDKLNTHCLLITDYNALIFNENRTHRVSCKNC